MQPKIRNLRKIAAFLFSVFVQMVLLAYSIAAQKPGKDDSFACIIAFVVSIVGSSLILERSRIDKFWKSFLIACLIGALPLVLYVVVMAIRFDYAVAGFVIPLILFGILFTIAAVCSLPFVALAYRFRSPSPVS